MPILANPKHERFAQEIAQGKSAAAAYVIAGYSKNDSNASRLNANERVRSRVDELLSAAAEKAGVTIERIVAELAKIGFSNAGDFFNWGPDGVTIKPSSELTSDQLAVVAEVQETRSRVGENTIRVKLSDKQAALEKLGRHLGMFKDKSEANVNVKVEHSADDAFRDVVSAMESLGRTKAASGRGAGEVDSDSPAGATSSA